MSSSENNKKRDSFEQLLKGGSKSVSKRKARKAKRGKQWFWIFGITFFIGLFTLMIPFVIAVIWWIIENLIEWMG